MVSWCVCASVYAGNTCGGRISMSRYSWMRTQVCCRCCWVCVCVCSCYMKTRLVSDQCRDIDYIMQFKLSRNCVKPHSHWEMRDGRDGEQLVLVLDAPHGFVCVCIGLICWITLGRLCTRTHDVTIITIQPHAYNSTCIWRTRAQRKFDNCLDNYVCDQHTRAASPSSRCST